VIVFFNTSQIAYIEIFESMTHVHFVGVPETLELPTEVGAALIAGLHAIEVHLG
jgi:hypothetical protein